MLYCDDIYIFLNRVKILVKGFVDFNFVVASLYCKVESLQLLLC